MAIRKKAARAGILLAVLIACGGCDAQTRDSDRAEREERPRQAAPDKRAPPVRVAQKPKPDVEKIPVAEKGTEKTDKAPRVAATASPAPKAPQQGKPAKTAKIAGPKAMPAVLMSKQHRDSCRVFVGGAIPDVSLPGLDGKKKKLADEFGKALTVLFFFSDEIPTIAQQLRDMGPEVADRYADQGVQVIGVAVRQPRDKVADLVAKRKLKFPILLDEDGKAYDKLATGYVPRIFLLDPTGKVLWLDLEYSATTRRQLAQAILYSLEHSKQPPAEQSLTDQRAKDGQAKY